MQAFRGAASALLCISLAACGGIGAPGSVSNKVPAADAGRPFSVPEGASAILQGQGSDADGRIVAYRWTQVSGPAAVALTGTDTPRPRFFAPYVSTSQALVFELVVTDNGGASSAPAQVTITVTDTGNLPPNVNAGADRSAIVNSSVSVRGSVVDEGAVSYLWTRVSGPDVVLSGADTAEVSFTAPDVPAVLRLRLQATDVQGLTGSDEVEINVVPPPVNQAPVANAGLDQSVSEGTAVTLSGSASDADGSIASLAWTQVAGPPVTLSGADSASAQFSAPQVDENTVLRFRLTATDDDGATGSDLVDITVEDPPETAMLSPEHLLDALLRGCDVLDTANCLMPFPSDHFTVAAPADSPQALTRGGTGRRVNIGPLATPRNLVGKPIDPSEWNRNDGFSPGALITTYVPGLSLERTYGLPSNRIGLANLPLSLDPNAPVLLLEVPQAPELAPRRAPAWAELDANAGLLVPTAFPLIGDLPGDDIQRSGEAQAALLVRPAQNLVEGRRYVVVLRRLRDAEGARIPAQGGFASCRDRAESLLPPLSERCEVLEQNVFPVLQAAGIARDNNLYLAWDFTVASTNNQIGRMRHMRDDAFRTLSQAPDAEDCTQYRDGAPCGTPEFTVDEVTLNPQGGIAKRIEGTITVPSYLLPFDASPLESPVLTAALQQLCAAIPAQAPQELRDGCGSFIEGADIARALSLPPNHLFYRPGLNPADPQGSLYGDGLPDRTGNMTTRYICQIPEQATPDTPARAGIYGHGLLDSRGAVTYDGVPELSREFNYMFCAVDFFGFATGDLGNVGLSLVDLSNFRAIPDASQQGFLNFMFLARLLRDPRGFASDPAFQAPGTQRPLFDFREVFYDGNSQGGILGGSVVAASKDVRRGVLGSLGMNYSTLLTRSTDFDVYAGPLYLAYTDPLDRQLLFSMIQMLWDRSENNGYAAHLSDNEAFGGDDKIIKLDPQFGDHQVTMYAAAAMARTMGVPYDIRQTERVAAMPDLDRDGRIAAIDPVRFGLQPLDYANDAQAAGSAMVVWDDPRSLLPPFNNVPPRAGRDPHDDSAKKFYGRCQKAHFLRSGGRLVDVTNIEYGEPRASCPAVPPALPVPRIETVHAPTLEGVLGRFVSGVGQALAALFAGDFGRFVGLLQASTGSVSGGLLQIVAAQTGNTAPAPQGPAPDDPDPVQLKAGAAKRVIRVPVGAPLGGYLRPPVGGEYIPTFEPFAGGDPIPFLRELADFIPSVDDNGLPLAPVPDEIRKLHSPYATFSPPSRGYYDSLIAKAVALHDGHDYVVLVKTDFIGMIDEVVQRVKEEVKRQRPEYDLGDGLVMSGTHTHDGPGAIGNHSLRYFWLAIDAYQPELFERLVPQLADVVIAALDDMQDARFGYATGTESNRDLLGNPRPLNSFRRGRAEGYDLDCSGDGLCDDGLRSRIGVLRVDRIGAAGPEPLALVMNYSAHGIAFDVENLYFSGDVLGAAEREVEQGFDSPMVAMFVQSAGGDVSPRADGGNNLNQIERFGKLLAPQVRAIYEGVDNFDLSPDLRTVSQRVVLNRERLGYTGDEFPYEWGAAQCNNNLAVPFINVGPPDEAPLPDRIPYCLPAPPPDPNDLADNGVAENGAFVPQDTRLTAVKIGRALLLAQPGEPLSEYGVRVLKAAREVGFNPEDTFIWGYSQDHIGYIMAPSREDWERGGTEGTTTFWGWKQGQRLIDVSRELARALRNDTAPPPDEFQVNYTYDAFYRQIPGPVPTPSLQPGNARTQPQDIARFQRAEFTWEGGDPVVDVPTVTLEKRNAAGGWEPARRANGEPVNTYFEMHLEYTYATTAHIWRVEFEAPLDWATGEYRFRVDGTAFRLGNEAYSVTSDPFQVTPARTLQVSEPVRDGAFIEVTLAYAPVPGNYRLVDPRVRTDQPAPVRNGVVTFSNAAGTVVVNTPRRVILDGERELAVYRAQIAGTVSVAGLDLHGNTTPQAPPPSPGVIGYGSGVLGALAEFFHDVNGVLTALVQGDLPAAGERLQTAVLLLSGNLGNVLGGDQASVLALVQNAFATLSADPTQLVQQLGNDLGALLGLDADPLSVVQRTAAVERRAEPVVLTGASVPAWSVPAAFGAPYPYPSGAAVSGGFLPEELQKNGGRHAHNGVILYPLPGAPMGKPVERIAAYKWNGSAFVEIPVQVDQKFPFFLANSASDFSTYSGTDEELTYEWDKERWQNDDDPANPGRGLYRKGKTDPVSGLDSDDEIVFMAQDAGAQAPLIARLNNADLDPAETVQEVALVDALDPSTRRFVYLALKRAGSKPAFIDQQVYVRYERDQRPDRHADQWIDRYFFADNDPEKIGTRLTNYGPNRSGTVRPGAAPYFNGTCTGSGGNRVCASTDRFARDATTVTTDAYEWFASGRWMIRSLRIAQPGQTRTAGGAPGAGISFGPDLIDRWKGRAFQQSPDSNISIVGFEDEQVNWEANATLLGDRVGPVRAIREVWGADSGTNVTKVETFYRDVITYRYRVRVHPIPPDGLYTSWDYNRSAMVPEDGENVPGGRYYTILRPQGVPIDGINDDLGQIDGITPIPTADGMMCISADAGGLVPPNPEGRCPAFFDVADPTFNLPLAFNNWEQVSGKGSNGSLVYTFELTGATSLANPLVVPYYRDDACLDDGTGDNPVQRPYPGEGQTDMRVRRGYVAEAGGDPGADDAAINAQFTALPCSAKQGAYGAHGVHYFLTHDSDNAFVLGKPNNEIDGRQWQFAVPTAAPTNVGDRYANIVRVPLLPAVTPRPSAP